MSIYKDFYNNIAPETSNEQFTESINKKSKTRFSKKAVIIPVIIIAVLALTGAAIHQVYTIGYEMSDIISELKVGRYYLETVDGFNTDCYIEVFKDNKLQFFGIETKKVFENGNSVDWSTAPVDYKLMKNIPFIALNDAWDTLNNGPNDGGGLLGIIYEDENTLCWNIYVEEYPNAKNYTRETDKENYAMQGIVYSHFVYEPINRKP